jgi:hypothetical protein
VLTHPLRELSVALLDEGVQLLGLLSLLRGGKLHGFEVLGHRLIDSRFEGFQGLLEEPFSDGVVQLATECVEGEVQGFTLFLKTLAGE